MLVTVSHLNSSRKGKASMGYLLLVFEIIWMFTVCQYFYDAIINTTSQFLYQINNNIGAISTKCNILSRRAFDFFLILFCNAAKLLFIYVYQRS
jgi:hypothetical protein